MESNTRGAESLATVREFLALNELEGVKNLRIVADCLHCELPFDLAEMHDCEVVQVGRLVDVFALYLCTTNDTSGNPRRGWVVFRGGTPSAFVFEGYKGEAALSEYLGESAHSVAGSWYRVYVAPSEFKNWVKKCKNWDGVEVVQN